jgi:hypothetical protein
MARSSLASLTTINDPAPGEDSLPTILGHSYGGTFTPTSPGSADLSNGTLTAVRIDDGTTGTTPTGTSDGTSTLQPVGGSDELWQGTVSTATALAVFAAHDQFFGYIPEAAGGSYAQIFSNWGVNYDVNGAAAAPPGGSLVADNTGVFRFARFGDDGWLQSSSDVDNSDGMDHMITYQIDGLGNGVNTYVLCFEDTPKQDCGDFDFNDLVVQVTGPEAVQVAATPEPATGLGLCTLGLMLASRRRP